MTTADTSDFTPLWLFIDELRRDKGWTWAELGRRSDVAPSLINRWKKSRASEANVRSVADGFELSETERTKMLELANPPKPLAKLEAALRAETALSKKQKELLMETARAFAESHRPATQNGPNAVDPD